MNYNKLPKDWALVDARAVGFGSQAQAINVLEMALQDIARMAMQIKVLERKLEIAAKP